MEKINKLTLPATILIGSIILGGFYYVSEASKQASIEKQQQVALQAKTAADQVATNDIDSQQKCATQAQKTFKENYSDTSPGNGSTYYDHWNIKLKKCFILVISEFPGYINKGIQRDGHDKALYDAFEGVNYGDYTYYTNPTDFLSKQEPFACAVVKNITATSDSQESCKSEAEFDGYVSAFMNN